MRVLFAGLLLLASSFGYAQNFADSERSPFDTAASNPVFLPVEEAYQLEVEILDDRAVRVYWQIADSYYLYQHRFAFSLRNSLGPMAIEAELPPALQRSDEYFGEVQVYYHNADVLLRTPQQIPQDLQRATLSVTSQGCADAGLCYPPQKQYFELDFAAGTAEPTAPPPTTLASQSNKPNANGQASQHSSGPGALLYMLALAFIGGSILNLMPCVFPILSLKVLGFARSTDHDRHLHSWIYTAGVITSFVLVAAVLIGLQRAGSAIGWGFQLQSPTFVIALAYLFIAMGLSLSGLVEFGGGIMNTGSGLANRSGYSGSFFTGVLAVVVASPCTAPFMGTALGFAVTQPPHIGLLVFAALGAGMAAPLLLFSYSGAARKLMPRPGPWMETLKQLLAFPLYGTAIWLLWVAGRQTGINTMTVALSGALVLAMGLWLWRYSGWRRGLGLACMLGALSLGAWRGMDESGNHASQLTAGKIPWSQQNLDDMRRAGNAVFVDVTADWCITCIANESAVLFTDEMTAAFSAHGVVYMVADWTNYNAEIANFLEQHGRTGIPLYLMYPADVSQEPVMLPQLLTQNTVLEALRAVSPKKPEVIAEI
ncbi:MAG: protein-disulfide reductase DsbD [Halioglobus sp.]